MVSVFKKELGQKGEEMAVNYLIKSGYKIVARNFRCRSGEIDIVAIEGEYTVFIEVKTRTGAGFGTAAEAVNYKKQKQIHKAAAYYLMKTGQTEKNCRFDVVTVHMGKSDNNIIEIIKNAF